MSDPDFTQDVLLSHNSKDKAVVRAASLSASNGERMWCRNGHFAVRLKEAGLRLWFDEWELPVAASRQSAAFLAGRQPRAEENGGALPKRRYAARIAEGLEHSQLALQPSTFSLHPFLAAPIKGSLAQFRYLNWLPAVREQARKTA